MFLLLTLLLLPSLALANQTQEFEVPQEAVNAISLVRINKAIVSLRDGPDNPKTAYLLRQVTRISLYADEKPMSDSHAFYQNLGVAYHNLYLFLKSRGVSENYYYENAYKNYKKANKKASPLHKQENKVLIAALVAEYGDFRKARRIFDHVEQLLLIADFSMAEYVATYYAAVNDEENAIDVLQKAYNLRPQALLTWLIISDDFYKMWPSERFRNQVKKWKDEQGGWGTSFSLPPRIPVQFALPHDMDFKGTVRPTKRYLRKQKRSR